MIKIIDTFKDYKSCFQNKLKSSIEDKIKIWQDCYISKYPELEKKCKNDYELSGYEWKHIAESMVFNRTEDDFSKMVKAYENITAIIDGIIYRTTKIFNVDLDLNIVLYCGLCNSAGWVDRYDGKRAVLLGIDKIAELNWHTKEKIESLIYHELCHVVHYELRGEDDLPEGVEHNKYNEGVWRIYEEGFAQYFEVKLMAGGIDPRGAEWLDKCSLNEKELKKLYINALHDNKTGTRDFFGDWFSVLGLSDTGYFLGSRLIQKLREKYSIKEIAKLPFKDIEKETMVFLGEAL